MSRALPVAPTAAAATADAVAVAAGGIAGVAVAAGGIAGVAVADGGVWWCDTAVLSKKETTPCRVCEREGVVMCSVVYLY